MPITPKQAKEGGLADTSTCKALCLGIDDELYSRSAQLAREGGVILKGIPHKYIDAICSIYQAQGWIVVQMASDSGSHRALRFDENKQR